MKRNAIVSHRLRGFDPVDASLQGLKNALAQSITAFEIDTRFTKDGEILIHHAPYMQNTSGQIVYFCDVSYDELKTEYIQKNLKYLPARLVEFIREMQTNNAYGVMTYLDIKEFGREKEILRLFDSFSLTENLVIVSWLPEVLFAVHALDQTISLCFSHYPLVPGAFLKNIFLQTQFRRTKLVHGHRAFFPHNDYNKTDLNRYYTENKAGDDYEHLATAPITGDLLTMLQAVNGMVCCDMRLTNRKLVTLYHELGIKVAVYSARNEDEIETYHNQIDVDLILSDNHELCSSM